MVEAKESRMMPRLGIKTTKLSRDLRPAVDTMKKVREKNTQKKTSAGWDVISLSFLLPFILTSHPYFCICVCILTTISQALMTILLV